MKEISTDIIINAPEEKIWSILTDFDNYKNWNPFIINSTGKPILGSRLINHMKQKDKIYVFKPKLTKVNPNQYLEWLGTLGLPGFFDGRHSFTLEEISPTQVKLTQKEKFTGILSGVIIKSIGEHTKLGFIAMNEALKREAEKYVATSQNEK